MKKILIMVGIVAASVIMVVLVRKDAPRVDVASPAASQAQSVSPVPDVTVSLVASARIVQRVPFTAQAPLGQWSDPRQQDGCEEASLMMAAHWVQGTPISSKQAAIDELLKLSKFGEQMYGTYHDTSVLDTAKYLSDFYHISTAEVRYDITLPQMIDELRSGKILLVPTNGQKLKNPNYTAPGPVYHMLVVIGYDPGSHSFITNDPGTRNGAGYHYAEQILFAAISAYDTGLHVPRIGDRKAMITVSR